METLNTPSLASEFSCSENTYATFAMNLKHRGDIAMIKDCLLLDSEQAGYVGKLEVGWAVAKLQGRHFKPFLLRCPLLPLVKGTVTDAKLRKHISVVATAETFSDLKTMFPVAFLSRKEFPFDPTSQTTGFQRFRIQVKRKTGMWNA